MRKIIFLILMATLLLTGCANQVKDAEIQKEVSQEMYKKITTEEAKRIMGSEEESVILDVRTLKEFEEGHIENAVLIPHTEIETLAPGVLTDKQAKILVYCRTGSRSAVASKKLADLGYTNVYDFGGIVDWPYEVVKE